MVSFPPHFLQICCISKKKPLRVLSVETTVTNGSKSMKSNRNAAAGGCPQTAVIQFQAINHWEFVNALLRQPGSGLICLSIAQSPQTSVFLTPECAP